ncbi:MAG TPA: hypothetical protein VFE13_00375 [Caulobacteraceae bacterium]|jgi:hypothetical protein|nr:hypothetical protein [Caulobacteraceae bacterium]
MTDESERLAAIAARQGTVADKIRALAAEGMPRADIARLLGKRYQHVRNVLEADAQTAGSGGYVLGKADLSGVQEGARPFNRDDDVAYIERRSPTAFWIEVRPDGSLPLPAEIAHAVDGEPGRRVFAKIRDGRVTLLSGNAAMEEARALVAKYIPAEVDLVASFLADKYAEIAREAEDD